MVFNFCYSISKLFFQRQDGCYSVYPVEYKKGRPKEDASDILQLTAQAMCLEEMLSCSIMKGALFYGEIRRRNEITFGEEYRNQVRKIFLEMHQYFEKRYTPKVKWSKACNACSLKETCVPFLGKSKSVQDYIRSYVVEEDV